MATRKYRDWRGWWDGMRSKAMGAAATSLVTSLTTLLGTNGVASFNIPGLQGIGMSWKTALAQLVIQFVFHTVLAAAMYVQAKPDPDVITETVDTSHFTKDADGAVTAGTSQKVTTTPVAPAAAPPAAGA